MCYFNYYIHGINEQTVSIYFTLYKRYIMLQTLSLNLRESILSENKARALTNPNPENNEIYLLDGVNAILEATAKEQEFKKKAPYQVFGNYLDLLDRAESDEFCAVSDSYNASQTIPCSQYYKGPLDQGLTTAFSIYCEYFTRYSNIVQNSNLKDPYTKTQLLNSPSTTSMSIFLKIS